MVTVEDQDVLMTMSPSQVTTSDSLHHLQHRISQASGRSGSLIDRPKDQSRDASKCIRRTLCVLTTARDMSRSSTKALSLAIPRIQLDIRCHIPPISSSLQNVSIEILLQFHPHCIGRQSSHSTFETYS